LIEEPKFQFFVFAIPVSVHKLWQYFDKISDSTKELRKLKLSIKYHCFLLAEQLCYTEASYSKIIGTFKSVHSLLASVKFWDRYGDSKYKKLKLRLFNQYSLSNLDKIGYNIQESIVSFARLPLGHSFDFICLAPWGGLDSVIEEFEEDVTISSEEEDESHIQRVCS